MILTDNYTQLVTWMTFHGTFLSLTLSSHSLCIFGAQWMKERVWNKKRVSILIYDKMIYDTMFIFRLHTYTYTFLV